MTERRSVVAYAPRRRNLVSSLRHSENARCSHTRKYESAAISNATFTISKTVAPNSSCADPVCTNMPPHNTNVATIDLVIVLRLVFRMANTNEDIRFLPASHVCDV